MSDIEFVAQPPPARAAKYDWEKITNTLKEHPGQWGLVKGEGAVNNSNAASSRASVLRKGKVAGVKPGDFETAVRGDKLYARYVGQAQ